MNRAAYYERMKCMAREMRERYGLNSPRVLRSDLRRIYSDHHIQIIPWPYPLRKLNGAYFNDDLGATVMLRRDLPSEPMVFTMGHELKHHLADNGFGYSFCDVSNETNFIEIGAEIFAAELIFPEQEFIHAMRAAGIRPGACSAEQLVRLKRATNTTMHYASMVKRVDFLGYATASDFAKTAWRKLEDKLFGIPWYRGRKK